MGKYEHLPDDDDLDAGIFRRSRLSEKDYEDDEAQLPDPHGRWADFVNGTPAIDA